FFSSRRRHTRFSRDWSSDVCSSDLSARLLPRAEGTRANPAAPTAMMARTASSMGMSILAPHQLVLFDIGLFQCLDQVGLFVEIARPLSEIGLGDAGRAVLAKQHAAAVFAQDIVDENVLG